MTRSEYEERQAYIVKAAPTSTSCAAIGAEVSGSLSLFLKQPVKSYDILNSRETSLQNEKGD